MCKINEIVELQDFAVFVPGSWRGLLGSCPQSASAGCCCELPQQSNTALLIEKAVVLNIKNNF